MKNALTKSAQPTSIREILGDAYGEPPDAANILAMATRARNAKASGNKEEWRKSVNELMYTARKSQLGQEKKIMDMEQKHRDEMRKLNDTNSDLQRQVKDKANLDIVFELLREGKTKQAFRMMAVLDVNPENYKILAERLAQDETLDAFSGNPRAQKWIRAAKALPPEQAAAFIFDQFIKPGIENEQTPDIDVPEQAQKTQPMMLPPGVEDDRGSLDQFFGQLPAGGRSITDTMPQSADPLTYNNQGWNAQNLSDFDAFMGRDTQPGLVARSARERGIITPEEEQAATRNQLGLTDRSTEDTDNIKEARFMMSEGVDARTVIERLWPKDVALGREGAEAWKERVYRQIMDDTEMTNAEKYTLTGYLFGNRDVSQGSRSRFASDPDPRIDTFSADIRDLWDPIKNADKTTFGQSGLDSLVGTLNRIDKDPKLSNTQKVHRAYPHIRQAIGDRETATKRAEIDGMVNLIDTTKLMADHLRRFPSGVDPNAPGFWQNTVLSFFKSFGLTFQDDLSSLRTIQDLNLALFIKSISGAAVTDVERKFLEKIMTSTKAGHALNEATIKGLRNFIGTRLKRYYSEKLASTKHGLQITEQLIGATLPSGYFTQAGNFIERKPTEKPKTPDGRLGPIKGMQGSETQAQGNPEFMKKWDSWSKATRERFVKEKNITREQLENAGVPVSELERIFSGKK